MKHSHALCGLPFSASACLLFPVSLTYTSLSILFLGLLQQPHRSMLPPSSLQYVASIITAACCLHHHGSMLLPPLQHLVSFPNIPTELPRDTVSLRTSLLQFLLKCMDLFCALRLDYLAFGRIYWLKLLRKIFIQAYKTPGNLGV